MRPILNMGMQRRVVVVGVIALAVFAALTVAVTASSSLALDSRAFDLVHDLRAPWLDHFFRFITTFGLIAIVAPVVAVGAAYLLWHGHRVRGIGLLAGVALAWAAVWLTKRIVDRARPPDPLVHTSGQSYPSAHAANSVGWLALAIAIAVVVPARRGRVAVITAGALLCLLVGFSRVYLRAHYASDVLAGEALAVAMYALAVGIAAR